MHGKDIVVYYKGLFGIQTKIRLYETQMGWPINA
jgi:hypothetical protein